MKLKKMVYSSLFVATGVAMSTWYIPVGVSKCFPMQHLLNVVGAVVLGPAYGLMNAFIISLIRNLLGMGSLLAFPGSMIGALVAGLVYKKWQNHRLAALGEVLGTGLIGGLVAAPVAILLMGKGVGMTFFVLPFLMSTLVGSLLALILLESSQLLGIIHKKRRQLEDKL